jgi:hypothetical protein
VPEVIGNLARGESRIEHPCNVVAPVVRVSPLCGVSEYRRRMYFRTLSGSRSPPASGAVIDGNTQGGSAIQRRVTPLR